MSDTTTDTTTDTAPEAEARWEDAILTPDDEQSDAIEPPATDDAPGDDNGESESEGEGDSATDEEDTDEEKAEDDTEDSLRAERVKLDKRAIGLERKAKRVAKQVESLKSERAQVDYALDQLKALRSGDSETAVKALRVLLAGQDPYQFLTDLNMRMVGEKPAEEPDYVRELRDEVKALRAERDTEKQEREVVAQYAQALQSYDLDPYPEVAAAIEREGHQVMARVVHHQNQRTGLAGAQLLRYLCGELRSLGYGTQRDTAGQAPDGGAGREPREIAKPETTPSQSPRKPAITQQSSRDVPRSSLVEMSLEERRRKALDYINL